MRFIFSFLILIINVDVSHMLYGQNTSWNLLLEKQVDRHVGSQVYETDSFYYVVGTSIDTFGTPEQGFSISKVNKNDASIILSNHYEEKDIKFDFFNCRKGVILGNEIIISQSTFTQPFTINLFKININTLDIKNILNVKPPENANKYSFFFKDIHLLNDKVYILAEYYIGEINTPTFQAIQTLICYDLLKFEFTLKEIIGKNKEIGFYKLNSVSNNLIAFGSIKGSQLATGKMAIAKMDIHGNVIWIYESSDLSPIHNVKDIYPINDKEVLLASSDTFFDNAKFEPFTRWTVTRFEIESKKIIWSTFWNEPRKPNIFGNARIIKTKTNGEYFLMANDYVREDTLSFAKGKMVKFNDKGERIWQKTYYFDNKWIYLNKFYNIIPTNDSNYLIVGDENYFQAPWLVKIDEDGNILPIDTTSATADPDIQHTIPEIKIYPNPALHTIIINQGEIADMTYQLTDMTGAVVKTIPLPQAHHHVVWDISDVASGTYVLTMLQGGKVIRSRQQVVIK
jgi:hypothetical protein